MITPTRAYKASDGTVYNSLEEVKVAELMAIATAGSLTQTPESLNIIEGAVENLVASGAQVLSILKVKERKPRTVKPKVAKPAKKNGKKVTESEAAVA